MQSQDTKADGEKVVNKKRRFKCWATFEELPPLPNDTTSRSRCKKCGYMCAYRSENGTGNMLKHQKICQNSVNIRQMVMSSSSGAITVRNGMFDPKVFRDLITCAVVRHNLPLKFVEYEGVREAFL